MGMGLDEYQKRIEEFDLNEPSKRADGGVDVMAPGMVEKVLGLAGEAGETADKFKKIIRDKGGAVFEEDRREIVKELGDVLWYVASVARYMGVSLSEVAEGNVTKLAKRKEEGKLRGRGDNR